MVSATEVAKLPHDLAITNGMVSGRTKAPRIHVYHGCWVDHVRLGCRTNDYSLPWRTQFLVKGAAKEIWSGINAYRVAVSEPTAAELARWYRLRVHRVIPNGVDISMFAIGDRDTARKQVQVDAAERLALFIGRAEARKRPDIAVAAASRAGYRLLSAGSGSVAGATSLGVLSPMELRTWIQAVDCVLAPSDYEACSLAILEAMATGAAVVTTRVGYVRSLVAQVPAYGELTASAGDLDEFVRALRLLPSRQRAVAEATAFVRAENSLERFARHWSTAIEEALARRA
ncbi:glycosyltransferase family 4 protein [Micromonospora sp. C95]|uniref:glycosyltransferase family 4 protein n=1 Tax=Micromonospora sp. C95 TaxID=2824882 RepID=UPI001B396F49|nr:glycosyltransferase family 4 protein [Micromonospora sp. C95]MBQ1027360.1 glycosyltransferase family 4 protein [Micromonospora sp. C95]